MNSPRLLSVLLLIGMLFFSIATFGQIKPKPKYSFVIIMAQDLGYGDLSVYGADKIKTPNIDRMAKEGMRFSNFYSTPSASESRAAALTGCYPKRIGMVSEIGPKGLNDKEIVSDIALSTDEVTLADLLKQNIYVTSFIGQWSVGVTPDYLPIKQGFDEYFGIPYFSEVTAKNPQWPDLFLMEGDKEIEKNPDPVSLTKRFTARAVDFITRNSTSPFLVYLSLSSPHVPLAISNEYAGKSKYGPYGDVVTEIDACVGTVNKTLLKLGIDKTTMVIFTSASGPDIAYGNHAGSAGGLKEGKGTIFEGGVRVPFVVKFPEKVRGGQVCSEVGSLIDLLPTLSDFSHCPLPTTKIDGVSLMPVLTAMEKTMRARKNYYYYLGNELLGIRQGKWKLILPHAFNEVMDFGRDGKPGRVKARNTEMALYDIDADPSETNNLFDENHELANKLKATALDFDKDLEQNKRPAAKVE